MVVNYALIGSRIKELRKAQGLSQEALAAFSELSSVFISNIECNKKHPSLETLLSIADALGVTADALLVGNQQNCHYEYDADLEMLFYYCSATEKLCDRNRCTLRARLTVSLSSSESSSIPIIAIISCNSL